MVTFQANNLLRDINWYQKGRRVTIIVPFIEIVFYVRLGLLFGYLVSKILPFQLTIQRFFLIINQRLE